MNMHVNLSLTDREAQLLEFLRAFTAEHGWAPSTREAAEGIGVVSTSTVSHQLKNLERRGLIKRGSGARKITVCDTKVGNE